MVLDITILPDSIRNRIQVTPGCWLWKGGKTAGYGYARHEGKHQPVHRIVYVLLIGPLDPELEIDHVCHDPLTCNGGPTCPHRSCVNPLHLVQTSHDINMEFGNAGKHNRIKTSCPRGHPYDNINTYFSPNGYRYCLICQTLRKTP